LVCFPQENKLRKRRHVGCGCAIHDIPLPPTTIFGYIALCVVVVVEGATVRPFVTGSAPP
jgi:hypothetical protein